MGISFVLEQSVDQVTCHWQDMVHRGASQGQMRGDGNVSEAAKTARDGRVTGFNDYWRDAESALEHELD